MNLEQGQFSIRPVEQPKVVIETVDEHDPGNVLTDTSTRLSLLGGLAMMGSLSREGFAENAEKQGELASYLISRLNLKGKGSFLDVGFGVNIHVSNKFSDEGIESFAIEGMAGSENGESDTMWHAPKHISTNEKGVNIFNGNISEFDEEGSDLKNQKFGTILFNGSWESGGNNWTVAGEVMEAKYHKEDSHREPMTGWMDKEKDFILKQCIGHLNPGGVIGIVSSRYAFHGEGYNYNRLPDEKLSFADAYLRFVKLGAKKITIIGMSQKSFDELLVNSNIPLSENLKPFALSPEEISSVRENLRNAQNLPTKDTYSEFAESGHGKEYQEEKIKITIENVKDVPAFNDLARIDAIFAEF